MQNISFEQLTRLPVEKIPHDIIVGSGHAGLSLALELSRKGRSVLVLESGLERKSAQHQDLAAAETIDLDRHDDMRIATCREFGGTSNYWGARCQPMDPIDFVSERNFADTCWPIPRTELCQYASRAAALLQCGAPKFSKPIDGLNVSDTRFKTDQLERFSNIPKLQKAHADEIATTPFLSIVFDCTVTGAQFDGDRLTHLELKSLAGAEHVLPVERVTLACGGVESTRTLLIFQKKSPMIAGGIKGALGRYYMGHIIGEVADLHLASPELDEALDFHIDTYGSYVRHRLIPNDAQQIANGLPNISFWPVVPPIADSSHRDAILSMVFLAFRIGPIGRLLVAEAIRKRHIPEDAAVIPHIRNVILGFPRAVLFLPFFFKRRYFDKIRLPGFFLRNKGRVYGLSYHSEQSPGRSNGFTLAKAQDALGRPKLNIDLQFSRKDVEAVMRAHLDLDAWLRANELGYLSFHHPKDETSDAILKLAAHGTHQIGTARMAKSPDTGCVNENLKVFGTANLYLCSSATFPSSGQCNPTFTLVSLACRLADHLANQNTK